MNAYDADILARLEALSARESAFDEPPSNAELDTKADEVRTLNRQLCQEWRETFEARLHRRAQDLDRMARLAAAEDPWLWERAIHEASHVIGWQPHGIAYVSIFSNGQRCGLTFVRGNWTTQGALIGTLAGPVGQSMLLGKLLHLDHRPRADAWYVEGFVAQLDPDFHLGDALESSALFRGALAETRQKIEARRRDVLLLAVLLTEFGVLGSTSVEKILGTHHA